MRSTFQNAGSPLSMGLFFSILVIVLSSQLPAAVQTSLVANGVPAHAAIQAAHIPPTGALFASFLGYNPVSTLLGPDTLAALPPAVETTVTGTHFFPTVIGTPFADALHMVFWLSAALVFAAAVFSYLRGGRYVYDEIEAPNVVFSEGGPEASPDYVVATRNS